MTELVLTLPAPPSVNNLFATVGKKRVTSRRYSNWKALAWIDARQQVREWFSFPGKVDVTIEHERRSRRTDLDNLNKAPLDFLVLTGVLKDDSAVETLTCRWSDTVKGMQITVRAA